ncbi:MAG TPA: hypothetical protein VJC18_00990, partial [bacterium]|nr:hypothetical protein [bacterium]
MLGNQLAKQANVREAALIMVAVLGLAYLAFDYLYAPKKQAVVDLMTEIGTVQEQQESIEKLNKALELKFTKMESDLQQQSQQTVITDPRVLMLKQYRKSQFKNVSDLLQTVMEKTSKSSVTMEAIKHEAPESHQGFFSTPFTLDFYGRFVNI